MVMYIQNILRLIFKNIFYQAHKWLQTHLLCLLKHVLRSFILKSCVS